MSIKYLNSATPVDSLDIPGLGVAAKGLKVTHHTFGKGQITFVLKFRDGKHAVVVDFERYGPRMLSPDHAKLERA